VTASERAIALGEEFTEYMLVDEKRKSIIINIEDIYFNILYREYKRLGFYIRHVTYFKAKNIMTCVFSADC